MEASLEGEPQTFLKAIIIKVFFSRTRTMLELDDLIRANNDNTIFGISVGVLSC